jgi:hypothetical protein
MEAVGIAVTNEMRRQGSDWDGSPAYAEGIVSRATVCTKFDWVWLAFPIALLLSALIMLVSAFAGTLFDRYDIPIWKSSALPLVFTENGMGMKGASKNISRVEEAAKQAVVRLVRDGSGWKFVRERMNDVKEDADGVVAENDISSASNIKTRSVSNGLKQ